LSKKKNVSQEEANEILKVLYDLRKKSNQSKESELEYNKYRDLCAKKFDFLVERRARRYKNFANYDDLKQDGRLALILALNSYKPGKGDFIYWANQYIKTKISREANRHSTIRIPIKQTKFVQPHKVSQLPIIVDSDLNASEQIIKDETENAVYSAVMMLPEPHRQVIKMHYEFGGYKDQSIAKICQSMNLSRGNCIKLLNEARESLKNTLVGMNI
jgi:RNA polymerase sigma factor (sigma-70 family)